MLSDSLKSKILTSSNKKIEFKNVSNSGRITLNLKSHSCELIIAHNNDNDYVVALRASDFSGKNGQSSTNLPKEMRNFIKNNAAKTCIKSFISRYGKRDRKYIYVKGAQKLDDFSNDIDYYFSDDFKE